MGTCTETGKKLVIKQIDILNSPEALIKELQVISVFTADNNINHTKSKENSS